LHYTLTYGDKELTWVEQDCHELHKAKEIRLEYLLGQSDQTVKVVIAAKPKKNYLPNNSMTLETEAGDE